MWVRSVSTDGAAAHLGYLLPEGSQVLHINGYDAGQLARQGLQELLVTSLTLTIHLKPALHVMPEVSRTVSRVYSVLLW